jgi:hypothetical protein
MPLAEMGAASMEGYAAMVKLSEFVMVTPYTPAPAPPSALAVFFPGIRAKLFAQVEKSMREAMGDPDIIGIEEFLRLHYPECRNPHWN